MWSKTEKKMSRRYGKVERSRGSTINEMLLLHREEVFAWIEEKMRLDYMEPEEAKATEDLVVSLEKAGFSKWTG